MMIRARKSSASEPVSVFVFAPFSVRGVRRETSAGKNVAAIVAEAQPDEFLQRHAHVFLQGECLPREKWKSVYPKAGTTLHIRAVPSGGGGGKNPLRTVLSLAIMAASPVIAGGLAGFAGVAAGRFVTAGVNLLGRLALNALAPPPKPRFAAGKKESQTLFIQGARNQAVPFGRVPQILGRHRFVPPLGALPYTETAGNDQYLRMLFVWGYGPLRVSDLKIGETPLSEFDGVEVETREGFDTDAPLTLYTNSVLQNDLQVALKQADGYVTRTTETDADEISVDITLPRGLLRFNASNEKTSAEVSVEVQYSPAGLDQWSAGAVSYKSIPARTSDPFLRPEAYQLQNQSYETVFIYRLALDPASGELKIARGAKHRLLLDGGEAEVPALPAGLIALARIERRSSDAALIPANRVTDERDLALFGAAFQAAGDFQAAVSAQEGRLEVAAGGLKFSGLYISGKRSSAVRKSISFKVAKGQYDVRVKRLTADATSDSVYDETVWTALRTIRYASPLRMTGLAVTALRMRATDQLQGVIDRFNGVVHSILPDWNGSSWILQETSNPASLLRHVLQGKGNARPLADARLDLGKIAAWHAACAASGREFNAVIDYDVSVREVLQDIASAGRASPALIDGKWSVVEDKQQTVPVQHFTPRNTWGFQGCKSFDDLPHALRLRFINRDKGYLQDERLVFDDGYAEETATKYETLELNGVTDQDQAWKDGRYHIASARLRPETYSFHVDIEHIVCTRGDLVRFTHDVPMFGLASARVKSVATAGSNITGVTLDAAVTMEAGRDYGVRFRKNDGASLVKAVATQAGESASLTFLEPEPVATAPVTGDLALFGESGQESVELVVRAIEPGGDLTAKITCVDAAPAIHQSDLGAIPVFSSQISPPPELQRPPVPVLSEIQSGEESLIRHTDGSFTTRILVTLEQPVFGRPLSLQAFIRAKDESNFRAATVLASAQDGISLIDVAEGEMYDIQLRYMSATGVLSAPLLVSGHRVTGTSSLPSDVSDLAMNVLGDTAHLSWSPVRDIDLSHYVLRYAPEVSGVSWSSAIDIVRQIAADATSLSLPAASGTYLLKAVDVGGRMSANAAIVTSALGGVAGYNAVLTLTESPSFSGLKTGVGVSGGALQLTGTDSIDGWADVDAQENVDLGGAGLNLEGTYAFSGITDLGAVYVSRLTATLAVNGIDLNTSLDTWDSADGVEDWDQDVDPSLWSVELQIATTGDDPGASPLWSSWAPFVVGDYTARAFKFRAVLKSKASNITPALSLVSVDIDMPERTASARGIVSSAGGTAVLFDPPFRATPVLSVTAQNMATGDYYSITSPSESGFTIRFFNSAGAGISCTFDYLAVGYGEAVS